MPRPKTGATQYHVQLGLSDKGRVIEGLDNCYIVWLGGSTIGPAQVA